MRTLPATLIAAGSALAVAGLAVAAQQPSAGSHTLSVRIPDGGVATITYSGDVAPRVAIGPSPAAFLAPPAFASAFWPAFDDGAGDVRAMDQAASPFAMMQRISAEMDREAVALLARAAEADASMRSGQGFEPGAGGYSFASASPGSGVCMRSVEITSTGDGRPPKVVRQTSGDCAGAPASGRALFGGRLPGAAAATALPRAETRPASTADDGPRFYQTAWRPTAHGQGKPVATDATLRAVSQTAD